MKFHGFCIFGVLFALMFIDCGRAESRGPVYGNISGAYLFQDRVTKGKIPLFTRSATFEYPVVSKYALHYSPHRIVSISSLFTLISIDSSRRQE